MNTKLFGWMSALIGAALICIGPDARNVAVAADDAKAAPPQVVLADTFNAVTRSISTTPPCTKARTNPALSSGDSAPMLSTG